MLEGLRQVGGFFLHFFGVVDEHVGFVVAEEARSMLQGVGSRFDFHINKTLCDLRYVSFFICANTISTQYTTGQERYLISSSTFQILWAH